MTVVSHSEDERPSQAGAQLVEHKEPEAASPSAPRDRLRSPALQGGIAFLIYLIVWVATAFRPVVAHPARARLGRKSQDPNLFAWCMRWRPYAIVHGLN